jgi:hypothetical protein
MVPVPSQKKFKCHCGLEPNILFDEIRSMSDLKRFVFGITNNQSGGSLLITPFPETIRQGNPQDHFANAHRKSEIK